MKLELTAQNVDKIFRKLLFKDDEDRTNYVEAHGVTLRVGFHPERLKENTEAINEMIDQLPDTFKKYIGGGWSFLNACQNNKGSQWADMHQTMDQLVCLGLATGKISFGMPREMWPMLPGSMPYFTVN